jgi:hypothetical protein
VRNTALDDRPASRVVANGLEVALWPSQRARDSVHFSFDSVAQGLGNRRRATIRTGEIGDEFGDECETCGQHGVGRSRHARSVDDDECFNCTVPDVASDVSGNGRLWTWGRVRRSIGPRGRVTARTTLSSLQRDLPTSLPAFSHGDPPATVAPSAPGGLIEEAAAVAHVSTDSTHTEAFEARHQRRD